MEAEEVSIKIRQAAALLRAADAIILTNGAGLGVDSGLGTFRGRYQTDVGSELESPYSLSKAWLFDEDPDKAWRYHFERYEDFTRAVPHAGYHIMLDLCKAKPRGFAIFTSNIDSHWRRVLAERGGAAVNPVALVECHGSIASMQCHKNCKRTTWPVPPLLSPTTLPPCPSCGRVSRFNVCLVSDNHFNDAQFRAESQKLDAFVASLQNRNVVVLEVGAGTGIPTVRRKSGEITRRIPGAKLIRINLDEAELDTGVDQGYLSEDPGHISIGGLGALDALTQIGAQ